MEADCECPPPPKQWLAPEKQQARLRVEKRKKGKVVTVIAGLSPEESDLPSLLARLKDTCGAGGAVKDEALELQGRHLERVRDVLVQMGYRVV